MKRYWVSWWSGYYADEGCRKPPFQIWISGSRDRPNDGLSEENLRLSKFISNEMDYYKYIAENRRDDQSICAVIDAEDEKEIWEAVKLYFPDYKERFCEEQKPDFVPSDRFPNPRNETKLEW